MNSFNSFGNSIRNTIFYVINKYIYNFPGVDPSLVYYYPLDSSNGNAITANYASRLPVYDASMIGSAMNTYNQNNFVTGLGDLSLNNTMGGSALAYVQTDTSFNLVPSRGLSISLWFSCSGQVDTPGTLISLYQQSINYNMIVGLFGSTLLSEYYSPPYKITITGSPTINTSISGYTQYLFNNNGTFNITNISKDMNIHIFAVAGGGAGGGSFRNQCNGGGGAGGVIQVYKTTKSDSLFNITVGAGGSLGDSINYRIDPNEDGKNTIVTLNSNSLITAYGGGGSGWYDTRAREGGSCSGNAPGGVYYDDNGVNIIDSSYNDCVLVFKAGNKGGFSTISDVAGGGGGAGQRGRNQGSTTTNVGGNGGNGITPSAVNTINVFTSSTYAGGGGGGNHNTTGQSNGGTGGGGRGCSNNASNNKNGIANTGGGGGGSSNSITGGVGGSGICIISIPNIL